jgi:hypothetical protein
MFRPVHPLLRRDITFVTRAFILKLCGALYRTGVWKLCDLSFDSSMLADGGAPPWCESTERTEF